MEIRAAVMLVLLAAGACGVRAQEEPAAPLPRYTLDQCIELGLERSIPLANVRRDAEIGKATVRQVKAQVYPALDVNGSYTRLDEIPTFPGITEPLGREDNYGVTVSADQLLFSGGAVKAAVRAAKYYRETKDLEVASRQAALIRDITKSFYEVLYTRATVDVAQESVKQLEEFEAQARLKFERETLSEFDWLSARVKLANERPRLVQARNNHALSKTAFRDLVYLDEEDFDLEGEMVCEPVATDLDLLQEAGLANRPELRQAQVSIRLRQADVRVSKGSYLPEVRAFANYAGTNPGDEQPAADEWEWGWNAGLSASWSLLDGGLRRAEIAEKALEEVKARAELDDLQRRIMLEIKNACLTLNNAREVVSSSEEGVDLALKAFEIARVRYERGLSTYLEFTDSNLALSSARLIHHQALLSYLQALADLRYACGAHDLPQPENNP